MIQSLKNKAYALGIVAGCVLYCLAIPVVLASPVIYLVVKVK